jgi:hypothetical protein
LHVVAELALQDPIDLTQLLLLAKLYGPVGLPTAAGRLFPGSATALFNGALGRKATLPF